MSHEQPSALPDDDRALYVISIAAQLAGVHPQTLRMYERKGLVQPQRTQGRARRYSPRDIHHVLLIQTLTQDHGVNLAGVEMVMALTRDIELMRAQMERLLEEAARMREQVARTAQTALARMQDIEPPFGTGRTHRGS